MRVGTSSSDAMASGPGWADSDAVLFVILGALVVAFGLSFVVGMAVAPSPADNEAVADEHRLELPAIGSTPRGVPLRVALIGDGPVSLSAIAPAGALDEAASVLIAAGSRSSDFAAAISTVDTDGLSVPEDADYRRASGRPAVSRHRELEALRMPGLMTPSASYIGAETPAIVPIGAVLAVPSWLVPLPHPLDPSRSLSASFGPET